MANAAHPAAPAQQAQDESWPWIVYGIVAFLVGATVLFSSHSDKAWGFALIAGAFVGLAAFFVTKRLLRLAGNQNQFRWTPGIITAILVILGVIVMFALPSPNGGAKKNPPAATAQAAPQQAPPVQQQAAPSQPPATAPANAQSGLLNLNVQDGLRAANGSIDGQAIARDVDHAAGVHYPRWAPGGDGEIKADPSPPPAGTQPIHAPARTSMDDMDSADWSVPILGHRGYTFEKFADYPVQCFSTARHQWGTDCSDPAAFRVQSLTEQDSDVRYEFAQAN